MNRRLSAALWSRTVIPSHRGKTVYRGIVVLFCRRICALLAAVVFPLMLATAIPVSAAVVFSTCTGVGAASGSCTAFDGSLGTLTSIQMHSTARAVLQVDALTPNNQQAFLAFNFHVSTPGGFVQTSSGDGSCSGDGGICIYLAVSNNVFDRTVNSGPLLDFLAAGNAPIFGTSYDFECPACGPVIGEFFFARFSELSVTYDYTLTANRVPEPNTLALLALGLAGLRFSQRKRV